MFNSEAAAGNLIGVIYTRDNPLTDFQTLIHRNAQRTLVIYNENVEQFIDKADRTAGGGNAVMRRYRVDETLNQPADLTHVSSLGIPTMFKSHSVVGNIADFNTLMINVTEALEQIRIFLRVNPGIRSIVWSSDDEDQLGLHIALAIRRISPDQAAIIKATVEDFFVQLSAELHLNRATYPDEITSEQFEEMLGIDQTATFGTLLTHIPL